MKYVVLRDFLDRFDNMRHCKPGEIHIPPNEERARQLIELGFIAPLNDEPEGQQHHDDTQHNPEKGKRKSRRNSVSEDKDDGENEV